MPASETRYAKSGQVNVAYQLLGDGPIDLVYVWGWISHLDFQWTDPTIASFIRRLASFARVIIFDKRGIGLSDPVGATPTFEDRMDDIRAVMDAVGSERAALLGFSEGAALSVLFAATHPHRTTGLILYDSVVVGSLVENGLRDPRWIEASRGIVGTVDRWGEGETMRWIAPTLSDNQALRRFWGCSSGRRRAQVWRVRYGRRFSTPTSAPPFRRSACRHLCSTMPTRGFRLPRASSLPS